MTSDGGSREPPDRAMLPGDAAGRGEPRETAVAMTGDAAIPGTRRLTGRERQVLAGIVAGLSNREIADWLSIAESTVKGHTVGIYRGLEVLDRAEAVRAVLAARGDGGDAGHSASGGAGGPGGPGGGRPRERLAGLPENERRLATLLGAFRGAFTRDGLREVAAGIGEPGLAAGLTGLLRAGVAERAPEGGYRLAAAVAGEAALALEASSMGEAALAAHGRWCAGLAERIGREAVGPGIDAARGLERICRLNLIAAFRRALAAGRPDHAAAILRPLYRIWDAAAVNAGLRRDIDTLVSQAGSIDDPDARSFVLFVAAYEAFQFDGRDEALAWVRRLGREAPQDPLFDALAAMCGALFTGSDPGARPALSQAAQALAERDHPLAFVPRAMDAGLAIAHHDADRGREAMADLARSMERAGNDFDRTVPLLQLGTALAACGRLAQARAVNRDLLALCRDRGFEHALYRALLSQAIVELSDDDPALLRAGALISGATDEMSLRLRMPPGPGWSAAMAQALRQAERRLGSADVRRLRAEGRAFTQEEVVALAMAR
ncbi:MAG: LuxR C-terminal-related transcriptional regulator [Chloroflexota bacterium]